MLEALMLVLLGALIAGLAALALAPLLWARAARVTTQRVQQDVHSAAFSEASEHVSQRYEGEIAQREGVLRSEIEQLEASREKISTEASGRVSALEESRTQLEQEIANRDAVLAEREQELRTLSENVRSLGARADALGREAADLGTRAGALSGEISDLGRSHHKIADTLQTSDPAPEPEPPATPEPTTKSEAEPETYSLSTEEVAGKPDTDADTDDADTDDADKAPIVSASLSDRIRALRNGVSA